MNNHEFHLSDAIDVIEEILQTGGEFRMYPKGTSMLPLLVQGRDSVVLKRKPASQIKKHDILFYRRDNGQFVLHRLMKKKRDGTFILCGDNQTTLERHLHPDQIIGYVSQIYKGDQLLSLRSPSHRAYMLFWMWMPLRRIVFFVRRCLRFLRRKIKV